MSENTSVKNIIGFCRVSTEEQGESRNGLEAQRKDIETWAFQNGYTVVSIIEEVTSGSLELANRPILQSALSLARKMKCKLLVSKVDRISRDAGLVHELMQRKKSVISVALGEEADSFVQHIYAGLAEKERKMIGERTKAGLAAAKARGVILGNRTNLQEARNIAVGNIKKKADDFACSLRPTIERMMKDKMSFKAIADELNQCGVKTSRGGSWHSQTVINLVNRWK